MKMKKENPITKFVQGLSEHIEGIEDEYIKEMTVLGKQMKKVLTKYREKGIDPRLAQAKLKEVFKKELL